MVIFLSSLCAAIGGKNNSGVAIAWLLHLSFAAPLTHLVGAQWDSFKLHSLVSCWYALKWNIYKVIIDCKYDESRLPNAFCIQHPLHTAFHSSCALGRCFGLGLKPHKWAKSWSYIMEWLLPKCTSFVPVTSILGSQARLNDLPCFQWQLVVRALFHLLSGQSMFDYAQKCVASALCHDLTVVRSMHDIAFSQSQVLWHKDCYRLYIMLCGACSHYM